ncbi:MAG: cation diffusion facilitator family transporter [Coriobacteriales bacterium]|nr:cation diffusion facilitator family transporter [Coriobacteriales bacterium]
MKAASDAKSRDSQIIRVSIVGILANVALAAFKAAVGLLSNSIAIVLDAVNNLSDAASSAITIVGTKLAGKPANHEHPYGYGRIEYLTAMLVSGIVLWAGLTSLVESVKGILNPQTPSYTTVGLLIIGVGVAVKLVLGRFVSSAGRRLDADALVASGADASFDAIISASTLVAALVFMFFNISLEAWLGAAISVVIIRSGIEMLREALDKVLGTRVDAELAKGIKQTTCQIEGVHGAYDLILSDYGPQHMWGSIHVEVDEDLTARDIDKIARKIQVAVMRDHQVILHTIGVYSKNLNGGPETQAIQSALDEIVNQEPYVLQTHGFYVDGERKGVTFDLVISYEAPNRVEVRDQVVEELGTRFPDYTFVAVIDSDVSD